MVSKVRVTVECVLLALLVGVAVQAQPRELQTRIEGGISIIYPERWAPANHQRVGGALELVTPQQTPENQPAPQARLVVTTEHRRNHEEALRRLKEIAGEVKEAPTFLAIGGWPALQRQYVAPLPRAPEETANAKQSDLDRPATFVTTAIANGDLVIRMDAVLAPDAGPEVANDALEIGRKVNLPIRDRPDLLEQELKVLGKAHSSLTPPLSPPARTDKGIFARRTADPSAVVAGFGELEVAVSSSGQDIVVARSGGIGISNDGGLTFHLSASNGSVTNFPPNYGADGDLSAAFGSSGRFYVSFIGYPAGQKSSVGTGYSTDRGRTFVFLSDAVTCPTGGCFTDQPHMAADRFVLTGGGSDQLYVVYRNFGPLAQAPPGAGSNIAAIACSMNGGTTWSAPITPPGGGSSDYPRIAVGPDSSVYVVYRVGANLNLQKYSSCATGLSPLAGFPLLLATVSDSIMCPIPGLDRCNGGNSLSSHMVAPDDTEPSQVYVSFANTSMQGNEDIRVLESNDGGQSFSKETIVSSTVHAHRFMPWICSSRGITFVSWYDRSHATEAANSLTDYVLATVSVNSGTRSIGPSVNLSGNADDQCATGFPGGQEFSNLATTCVPPQEPGANGNGIPKYGDYNGNACVKGVFFGAWASATAPPGLPPVSGITIFAAKFDPHALPIVVPMHGYWSVMER
jgi:hypothetical protein